MERRDDVELGHLRRHVRHLPELAQRAVDRVPSQPVAEQRERIVDCVWDVRARVSFGLHPAVVENPQRLPIVQQGVGLLQVGKDPRVRPEHVSRVFVWCQSFFSFFFLLPRCSA